MAAPEFLANCFLCHASRKVKYRDCLSIVRSKSIFIRYIKKLLHVIKPSSHLLILPTHVPYSLQIRPFDSKKNQAMEVYKVLVREQTDI